MKAVTDIQKVTFKLDLVKIGSLILCTASICFTIAHYVGNIEKTQMLHEYRIGAIEKRIDNIESKSITKAR